MLNPLPDQTSREDLFVERYQRLYAWSVQLTDHDHELAEDLLHDLYIQFTLNAPALDEIRNLDAYLYTMLRNLRVGQQRRETRNPLQQLSIIEYDSAVIGLRTVDFRDQIQAQDDLRRVCLYACVRKETSKSASVLILRFFHGYYPDEIVKILRTSRAFIDTSMKLARTEAKTGLFSDVSKSKRLEFINRVPMPEVKPTGYAQNLDVALEEIRQTIFQNKKRDCFTDDSLKDLYLTGSANPVECLQLSHLVSCRQCLDRVNALLGLPLLAERNASETLGRDVRKRGGPGGGSGGTGGGVLSKIKLSQLRRRAKDTLVHKPMELCVAVNGYTLVSQSVSSERSELNLVVDEDVRVSFVEVFSEQKIRLLMMGIEELPPDGPGERAARVMLSDERYLDLTLRLVTPSPTIQVIYSDPHFNDAPDLSKELDASPIDFKFEQAAALPVDDTIAADITAADATANKEPINERIRESQPSTTDRSSIVLLLSPILRRLYQSITSSNLWLRPQTATAIVASLLLASFIYFNLPTRIGRPSAAELLSQSIAAEDAFAARTDLVTHRSFSLEERDPDGKVLYRRRVELWHSAAKGVTARRLYDDDGRLLSGEWSKAGNPGAIYRSHHAQPQPRVDIQGPQSATHGLELWLLSPSARDFSTLIHGRQPTAIEERSGSYVLSYEPTSSSASGEDGLVRATLTLSRTDLHATELTLVIIADDTAALDLGDGDVGNANPKSEIRNPKFLEYRFIESAFERRAPDSVAPSVFEPDPELLVPAPETRNSKLETRNDSYQPPTPALATADLEVEVLRILNQAGADIDDQTNVTRTSDGKLQVSGLVDSKERKREILQALAPVANNPALTIRVETIEEAAARQKQTQNAPTTVERIEVTKGRIAVYEDVRRYLGKPEGEADDAVQRFAAQVLNRSRLVMSQAGTLKKLAGRFSHDDLENMTPRARETWLAVLRGHARNCEAENRRLRIALQGVLGGAGGSGAGMVDINSDTELQQVAARLFNEAAANDRVIRSAFTISGGAASVSPIKNAGFFRALANIEWLAESLQRVK